MSSIDEGGDATSALHTLKLSVDDVQDCTVTVGEAGKGVAGHVSVVNVTNATIVLFQPTRGVKITNATNSRLFLGVCEDQVVIDNCRGCSISGICGNLLVQNSTDNLLCVETGDAPDWHLKLVIGLVCDDWWNAVQSTMYVTPCKAISGS